MNPYVAAVELIHDCGIKDILIGDSEASISTLKNIQAYMDRNIMHIPCHLEKEYEYLYDQEIQVRKDLAEKIVRLTLPRTPDIPIFHNTIRQRGYIVMENKLAGRYSGEVHIIKESLPLKQEQMLLDLYILNILILLIILMHKQRLYLREYRRSQDE